MRALVAARRRWLSRWTAAGITLLQSACGGGTDGASVVPPKCTIASVGVSAAAATLNAGTATTLTATVGASTSCTGNVSWRVSPSGATLTPSGLTASFTAAAPGTFTVTATSGDDPTKSGSATLTVTAAPPPCGQATSPTFTHSTNVTANETWAGDAVHVVPNNITISGSAVVTVQPCAVVALGSGASISVGGSARLVAAGTAADRFVTFRRNNAAQAWGALRGTSATSLIDLAWTTLTGGGNLGTSSDPTIAVVGAAYGSPPSAVLRVDNVTIQASQGAGVYLDVNAAFTADSRLLRITGSGSRPIMATMMSLGSVPAGTYTGNSIDEVLIIGPNANVFADMTVQDVGVPVRIAFSGLTVAPAAGSTAPVTLTLRPGVIFKFPKLGAQPGARMTFGSNGNAPNNVVGVLNAIGTAAKPIVFTSGETTPAPGDWIGIWLNTANGSRLDYVQISYAGAPSGVVSNNCRPVNSPDNAALLVGDFSNQYVPPANLITNSTISNSAGYAIDALWLAPTFSSVDLTATNVFTSNARCRQTYNGLTPPGVCPTNGGCTVP